MKPTKGLYLIKVIIEETSKGGIALTHANITNRAIILALPPEGDEELKVGDEVIYQVGLGLKIPTGGGNEIELDGEIISVSSRGFNLIILREFLLAVIEDHE